MVILITIASGNYVELFSMSTFTSVDGEFSIDIPWVWTLSRTPDTSRRETRFFGGGDTYLYAYRTSKGYRSARSANPSEISVKVIKKTFSDEYFPSPEKLAEQLTARAEGLKGRWDDISDIVGIGSIMDMGILQSTVSPIRGYRWAKTVVAVSDYVGTDSVEIYYQLVIDEAHYYIVVFYAKKRFAEASFYEPIFEKMMQSFRYRPNGNR
jgi:hypothetical protein